MPFFHGPFKPKYKDINLYDTYRKTCIKDFSNILYERQLDREKQKVIIKKFKKEEFNPRKFYS
jgi:phenolic acid decarboxylase